MKKIEKIKIIYIILTIIISIIVYYVFIKEDDYFNSNSFNISMNEEIKNEELSSNIEQENTNKIIVYIAGEVKNQGIYEMEETSRIADIIDKAGGLTEKADIQNINLAFVIEDGMKIYIPSTEEIKVIEDNTESYITKENSDTEEVIKTEKSTKSKININTATQTELETLPGIGPSIALKIIEYRKENGKYVNIEDIKNVSGIGENKFSKIKELIKV